MCYHGNDKQLPCLHCYILGAAELPHLMTGRHGEFTNRHFSQMDSYNGDWLSAFGVVPRVSYSLATSLLEPCEPMQRGGGGPGNEAGLTATTELPSRHCIEAGDLP